jgi:protease IV
VNMSKWNKYAALLALACSACGGEPEREDKKLEAETLIELDLTPPLEEQSHALLGESRPSHLEAMLKVKKLVKDPLARGLFVRLGSFGGRFADVDDWAQLFEAFRAQKKPVHCHFDVLDNGGYALASHCDQLSMTPAGMLTLVGIGAQVLHGRELLDHLGVQAELLQVGKYKGAAEPFTRADLSEEQRQSLEALIADLDGSFRAHLARRAALGDVQAVLDGGPYDANDAHGRKLVDAVSYDDEARSHAKKAAGARLLQRTLSPGEPKAPSVRDLLKALSGQRDREYKGRPHLAVAILNGEISDGEGRGLDGGASDPFIKKLRRWGDDQEVRAVLLRIESPGGSAVASDRMWHAVQRVSRRKPVIVSLGDMAASGGYYIASAGNVIIASKGSIVGSIGVVGGKVVVAGLADRVGVNVTTLTRSQRSAFFSPFQPFSPAERTALEGMLRSTYGLFLQRVAIGRKREVTSLLPAAEGRVMGGDRALELGLVDEVGGLSRAIELALERGRLPEGAPIETWPDTADPLATLSSMFGAHAQVSAMQAVREILPPELASAGSLFEGLVHTPKHPLAVLPFALYVH